ncbi:MAG: M16 family metallopeptidase, partial [Planctomycetota bacterium]
MTETLRKRTAAALATALLALPAIAGCASPYDEDNPPPEGMFQEVGVQRTDRAAHPNDLVFERQAFEFRRPERRVLSNGMVLHLLEDHTLPLVNGSAYFRGGSVFDPAGKEGLSTLACFLVRQGGTKSLDPDALDEELDMLAGSIGVGSGIEQSSGGFSFMAEDVDRGIELFADVLRNPAFDEQRLQRFKFMYAQSVKGQAQSPPAVTGRAFSSIAYGGHPYGRQLTEQSIMSITKGDLEAYHDKWFHPDAFIVSVAGAFNTDEMVAKFEKAFAGWKKSDGTLPKHAPEFPREYRGGHYVVNMPGVTQTNLRMGH